MTQHTDPIRVAAAIGKLDKERGGAQQLLYDVLSRLDGDEFERTVYVLFGDPTYREAFEDADVQVVALEADGNADARAFARFVRRLRSDAPDVLHTHSPISGVWGRPAARLAGVEHVASTEHSVHDGYPLKHRLANGLTLPLADAVIPNSRATEMSLRWWERPLLRAAGAGVETIPNGIDVAEIAGTEPATDGGWTDGPVIGTVGRFVDAKGLTTLVRALPSIRERHPDVECVLVGDGPRREAIERTARELGVTDAITITSLVEDPHPIAATFDVAVFPSRWEGFGLAAAECMVAGVPVVASDIPAFREVVGDAGELVSRERPGEFAAAIETLLADPDRRDDLAEAGRDRIHEEFSAERVAEQYAAQYRALTD